MNGWCLLHNIDRLEEPLSSNTKLRSLTPSGIRSLKSYSLRDFFQSLSLPSKRSSQICLMQSLFYLILLRLHTPGNKAPHICVNIQRTPPSGSLGGCCGKCWNIWIAKHSSAISIHLIWDKFQAQEHLCVEAVLLVSFSGNFPVPHVHFSKSF